MRAPTSVIALLILALAAPAAAQQPAPGAGVSRPAGAARDSVPAAVRAPQAPAGRAPAATASRSATRPPAGAAARHPAPTAASSRTGVAPRRLEDIHIEGEIPAPQVLFITARDQRRFLGSQHRRFLRTARAVAEATPLPEAVIVVRPEPGPPR